MLKKLVVFGTGDFAEVAGYLFEHDSDYRVSAFTVDARYLQADTFAGLPVVPFETVQDVYPPHDYELFVAIGYSKVNRSRETKYHEAKSKGYRLATYISSKATVWDTLKIGDNCFVFEHNNIQPFAVIGSNVVLWSGNHIGHHAKIGDHVFVTSHVVISGRCEIGNNCFLGVNATLFDHVRVAPGTVIGAGALISRDTGPNEVFKAAPTERSQRGSGQLKFFGGNEKP